jgi:ABC-type transport system substrate-binding protein
MATLLMIVVATIPVVYAQRRGIAVDTVRLLTIKSPDAQLIAIRTGQIDFLPDLIRPDDIETLVSEDYLVQATPGFHMGFVGFNLQRPILDDVGFRHALFHAYNQEEIVASIYRYTVTPVQSLVPPAQGGWLAPDIPKHPYNPGDSTDAPGTHSTFGLLKGAGYTYYGTGYGDLTGYWEDPLGDPLPDMTFYTPTYEVAPTSAEHGARIEAEWHRCGLNNIEHEPADFGTYTGLVFDNHDFDIFMIFWGLSRFPLQLYGLCHSSEYVLGSDHAVGILDPTLDGYLDTLKYSLDYDEQLEACHNAQKRLYDETNSYGLAYMLLYSRVYFNAATRYLDGNTNQPGYGSDNSWSWNSWHWNTGDGLRPVTGDSLVIYCNGEETPTRSPLSSTTVYEWNTIGNAYDGLIAINPYTNEDWAWQAESWTVEGPLTTTITLDSDIDGGPYEGMNSGDSFALVDGMKVTFNLVDGLYWQDGNAVDAGDCEFSLEFLRDNEIPQFIGDWQDIVDVQRIDADEFAVYTNVTSQFLLYDFAGDALLLPPQVWSAMDGDPLADILAYDPTTDYTDTGPWSYADGVDGVPGTGDDPNPANIGPKTCLFGTGPLVFDFYDPVGMYSDLHNWDAQGANVGYFKTAAEIQADKSTMLHAVGDVDYNAHVFGGDQSAYAIAFGSKPGDSNWNAAADLNLDDRVNWIDGGLIGAFYDKKLEETKP